MDKVYFVVFSHLKDGKTVNKNIPLKLTYKAEIDNFQDIIAIEQDLAKNGYLDPCVLSYQLLGEEPKTEKVSNFDKN